MTLLSFHRLQISAYPPIFPNRPKTKRSTIKARGKRARSPNMYPDGALYDGPPLAYRLLAAEATDRVAGNARSIGVADAIIV